MKSITIIVSLVALTGCGSSPEESQAALMDEIEGAVRLPTEAGPLDSYARYYTVHRGSVHGAYTTEVEAPRPTGFGCEKLGSNGKSKMVACPAPADAQPGERRWVKFDDYPAVAGKDCTAIQLEFDLQTRQISYLECAHPFR